MRKSIVSMLSLAVAATLLTACGGSGQSTTKSSATTSSVKSEVINPSQASKIVTDTKSGTSADATKVEAVAKTKVFVSPEWIKSVIDGGQEESKDYVIIEAAWGEVSDDKAYTEGHIPGAVHMNTDSVESDEMWNIRKPEEITELMKKYGIT